MKSLLVLACCKKNPVVRIEHSVRMLPVTMVSNAEHDQHATTTNTAPIASHTRQRGSNSMPRAAQMARLSCAIWRQAGAGYRTQ